MERNRLVEIGESNAEMAWDQRHDYPTREDAREACSENACDTARGEGATTEDMYCVTAAFDACWDSLEKEHSDDRLRCVIAAVVSGQSPRGQTRAMSALITLARQMGELPTAARQEEVVSDVLGEN